MAVVVVVEAEAAVAGQDLCPFHQTIHPEVEAEAVGVAGDPGVELETHITEEVMVKLVIKYTAELEVVTVVEEPRTGFMEVIGAPLELMVGRPVDSILDFLMSKVIKSIKVYRFLKINGH